MFEEKNKEASIGVPEKFWRFVSFRFRENSHQHFRHNSMWEISPEIYRLIDKTLSCPGTSCLFVLQLFHLEQSGWIVKFSP